MLLSLQVSPLSLKESCLGPLAQAPFTLPFKPSTQGPQASPVALCLPQAVALGLAQAIPQARQEEQASQLLVLVRVVTVTTPQGEAPGRHAGPPSGVGSSLHSSRDARGTGN